MSGSPPPSFPRSALIVGGSKGIGRAVTVELSRRGVRTAIAYATDDHAAKRVVIDAAALGPEPVLVKGDVARDGEAIVQQSVTALGSLDAVVASAVPGIVGRVMDVTYEQLRRSMDVQVWGFLDIVRAACPHLEAVAGSAVAVSSLGAQSYTRYYGALGPAKAALELLVRYLGAELGPRGIRVNAVSPCLIDDGDRDERRKMRDVVLQIGNRTPMRRAAQPPDIAGAITELLGPAFGFVTGQTLIVDGGYSLLG